MKAEHQRNFRIAGRALTTTLRDAIAQLPPSTVLWEVTPDGPVPLAHRHVGSLRLNETRLTNKEMSQCCSPTRM